MTDASQLTKVLYYPHEEQTIEDLLIEGEIPPSISGVYWLNGPAHFRSDDSHWLDGDGMIRELVIANGRARYRSRYVKTKRYLEEADLGAAVYHRFGTLIPNGKMRRGIALESPANVSVYPFAGQLFAFGEQSLPYRLERDCLETLGECNFNGCLIDITPLSAHPKVDESLKRLCSFGIRYRMGWASLTYYEFDQGLDCVFKAEQKLDYCYSVHDFAQSEHFACFYLSPYTLDIQEFRKQEKPLAHCLDWGTPTESRLFIQSRIDPEQRFFIELDESYYCLHTLNAFEEDGFLYVDLLLAARAYYDQYQPLNQLFHGIGSTTVKRWKIDLRAEKVAEEWEILLPQHVDFPALCHDDSSRGYRCFWALAMSVEPRDDMKFYRQILRFDWDEESVADSWTTSEGEFLAGEPSLIAPNGENGASWVICQLYDVSEECSCYVLFEAQNLKAGPISKIGLPVLDPLAFHSIFVERS